MKIAVIGAGIAGLTAALRLSDQHEVTLFESANYLGGHAHTVVVEIEGQPFAIDTGFMVFNDWTYPNFTELLHELGVTSRPTMMGFSVQCERSGWEYSGATLNGLFAQRRNLIRPAFYRMIQDILRFNREAKKVDRFENDSAVHDAMTVGEFLEKGNYSREFSENYLLPMGSAIWSCPMGTFANFPIRFVIEFYGNHGLLNIVDRPTWRVIVGGSRSYVDAIVRRFPGNIRLNTPIERIRRHPGWVDVLTRYDGSSSFDHVVVACHADQALRMLDDPSPLENRLLRAFSYERSVAVLHTDASLLPKQRRAWASWNYHVSDESSQGATVTYCLSILQHIKSRQVVNLTLNAEKRIDPSKVLQRFIYEHPVFTIDRAAAQARHAEVINRNRTSFCGAYWRNGFHEDGVVSALRVCQQLNVIGQKIEFEQANRF